MSEKELIQNILRMAGEDRNLVERACDFAQQKHAGQTRFSSEPYFVHVLHTAYILCELGSSSTTIAAGLLHDTMEDAGVTYKEIEELFGGEVAFIVEGVSKLGKLRYHGADRHNESLRKFFVAMSQDIRVLMVKLADRLHNMRTLAFIPETKRLRIARETLEIYAPIAYRLGIRKINRELEDLAFPFVYPEEYKKTIEFVKSQAGGKDQEDLEKFLRSIKKELALSKVPVVRTEYRVKGLYSVFKKISRRDKQNIYDVLAVRIITPSTDDCYRALGVIHASWRPLPGRIKDFIAFPKPNGYQGLHTTVLTGSEQTVEVQIKTEEMYLDGEYGIAAHASYKETGGRAKGQGFKWISGLLSGSAMRNHSDAKDAPKWIKELVEYQKTKGSPMTDELHGDFFSHRIFAFTPNGDVIDLPINATPVDFAYAVHSEIGDHIHGAKVNGKMSALDTPLANGDIVEILTRAKSKPNARWLNFAKTASARKRIRMKTEKKEAADKKAPRKKAR